MSKFLRLRTRAWALPPACLVALLSLSTLSTGCTATHAVTARGTAELRDGWSLPVTWLTASANESTLARWRRAVGPPLLSLRGPLAPLPADELTVVSWNIANGAAEVGQFLATLPADRPVVLLLQEAFRGGPAVPMPMEAGAFFAGALGGLKADPDALDVAALAQSLHLNAYYVPSMRNGGPLAEEDRGNAILTNLPLTDLMAVELPFERQRRVAVAATVTGTRRDGTPWELRVVSAHLDNLASVRYGWIGGEFGRARQARGLRAAMSWDGPIVLGGDFNTWFGFTEPAFVETLAEFPDTPITDRRATFGGLLRLDHLFFRLDDGWQARFQRGDDRFGSDHYPLIGTISLR